MLYLKMGVEQKNNPLAIPIHSPSSLDPSQPEHYLVVTESRKKEAPFIAILALLERDVVVEKPSLSRRVFGVEAQN